MAIRIIVDTVDHKIFRYKINLYSIRGIANHSEIKMKLKIIAISYQESTNFPEGFINFFYSFFWLLILMTLLLSPFSGRIYHFVKYLFLAENCPERAWNLKFWLNKHCVFFFDNYNSLFLQHAVIGHSILKRRRF